jgi:cysteine synthase A
MKLVEELGPQATVVTVLPDSNKKYLSTALPQAEAPQDDYLTPLVQFLSFASVR